MRIFNPRDHCYILAQATEMSLFFFFYTMQVIVYASFFCSLIKKVPVIYCFLAISFFSFFFTLSLSPPLLFDSVFVIITIELVKSSHVMGNDSMEVWLVYNARCYYLHSLDSQILNIRKEKKKSLIYFAKSVRRK